MGIIIGADFIPTEYNSMLFNDGEVNRLISNEKENNLLDIIVSADYRIFNLEGPLYDGNSPIKKSGPILRLDTASINTYKDIGVDLFTLANNHIMDHGVEGYKSTIQILKEAGISYVGVGNTPKEAMEPFFFYFKEKRIGVVACVEHEFTIVDNGIPGANPIDYLETPDLVERTKKQCDYLLVLYHGGKEYYQYPSPELQKVCRKLADKGADLILVQHTHCIGCAEQYNGSTIVYGQGDFLFDKNDDDYWKPGLLIMIDNDFSIKFIPLEKKCHSVRLSLDESIINGFISRSMQIKNDVFIRESYKKFAKENLLSYFITVNRKESILFRGANKIFGGKLRERRLKKMSEQKRLDVINTLRCEAHRELFISGLKEE